MSDELGGEVKASEQAAFAVTGHEFNLGSPKQLQEVLFTELALPKTKRIKTGYTTDSEALTGLLAQTEHPVLIHLLRHRDVAKLKSIVDSLIPMADVDGRIHTTYNQMIAATGRLSSTDPNMQNIPIRTEEGRRIRQGFVVGRGYECLLTADYSQIELRIMAHLSQDEALSAAFSSGHDFHAATAGRVFGVAPEAVTPELRSKVKAMNYGLAYGLSAYGLSQQLRISPDEARGYMDEYFEQFGGVRDYLREVVARARMDGYTQTMLGRRRYLPGPDLRQPAAPGDGRADGSERADPGLGRRHHQGGHADGAATSCRRPACGRGCCSRCTTSCCSRWRRASWRRFGPWSGWPWAVPRTSQSRWRFPWAGAAAGPTPPTEPSAGRARVLGLRLLGWSDGGRGVHCPKIDRSARLSYAGRCTVFWCSPPMVRQPAGQSHCRPRSVMLARHVAQTMAFLCRTRRARYCPASNPCPYPESTYT